MWVNVSSLQTNASLDPFLPNPISRLLLELLVDDVDPEAVSDPLHLGAEVAEFLDGLDLLVQVVLLDEGAEVRVILLARDGVQLQQGLEKGINRSTFSPVFIDKMTKHLKLRNIPH